VGPGGRGVRCERCERLKLEASSNPAATPSRATGRFQVDNTGNGSSSSGTDKGSSPGSAAQVPTRSEPGAPREFTDGSRECGSRPESLAPATSGK
jgi:hypothetical protein